jgi:hypothetical protein
VGEENIYWLRIEGRVGVLAITPEGRKRLQAAAKRGGLTKRQLIEQVVHAGGT